MSDRACGHAKGLPESGGGAPRWMRLGAGLVFAVGGGYYLWTQHRAHVLQYLPLAIFLLCPLMHLFGGHGRHGGHSNE